MNTQGKRQIKIDVNILKNQAKLNIMNITSKKQRRKNIVKHYNQTFINM